jgi:hypothetical protein
MQECLLHLWKLESERPGCTRSWYLQSCRFHSQHFLAFGRSLNSLKRSGAGSSVPAEGEDDEPGLPGHHTDVEPFERVSFVDVISTLGRQLKPREHRVLLGLANGMVLREIASNCGISYPTALKARRKIAALTIRLGISQPLSPLKENGSSSWQPDEAIETAA